MNTEKLDWMAITERMEELPGWQAEDEEVRHLHREYIFKDFAEALEFVNRVGAIAEALQHHPEIDIRWNKVRLLLTTHSKRGLTELDFAVATAIEKL